MSGAAVWQNPRRGKEARVHLTILTGCTALVLVGFIFELVRRRRLREKYAVLWIVVGVGVLALGLFPRAINWVAGVVGVANGASLVLFSAVLFLLVVCLHLSWEASRLEDETRVLAEEVALLRLRVEDLADRDREREAHKERVKQ
jgi:hypothetical protein